MIAGSDIKTAEARQSCDSVGVSDQLELFPIRAVEKATVASPSDGQSLAKSWALFPILHAGGKVLWLLPNNADPYSGSN